MMVTLRKYNGSASCQGIEGVDTSQQFKGSLDELSVFTRQIQISDVHTLLRR